MVWWWVLCGEMKGEEDRDGGGGAATVDGDGDQIIFGQTGGCGVHQVDGGRRMTIGGWWWWIMRDGGWRCGSRGPRWGGGGEDRLLVLVFWAVLVLVFGALLCL